MRFDAICIEWDSGPVRTVIFRGETEDVEIVNESWDEKQRVWRREQQSMILPNDRIEDIIAAMRIAARGAATEQGGGNG